MKPRLPRGAVLMICLFAIIALLNRASDWWDDTFGPTGTGPRSVQTTK
jgi:hypothetical protein